jgi:plasmid stabilization system protein ParE
MAKKVIWTTRSHKKFKNIVNYLEEVWGSKVAENFVVKTFNLIDIISEHPELGTLEHPEKRIRGFLLTRHNKLFYRVTETEIILLNFFDTRSGPERNKT